MPKAGENPQSEIKRVAFVLCEGAHDTAFLYRLFKAKGSINYTKPIGKFPHPINSFIKSALEDEKYENLNLMELRKKPLPSVVLSRNESLLLLYAMGGRWQKKGTQTTD